MLIILIEANDVVSFGVVINRLVFKRIYMVRIIIYNPIKFDRIFRINEYNNRIQFASRHMIIADLEQITSETQVSKKRNKKYRKKLTKDNAIVEKIILSFKRTDLHLVFPTYPFSKEANSISFINVLQLFYNEFDSMIIKKREGMYLPFTDMEILFKFYSLIVPLNIIAIIIVSVILSLKYAQTNAIKI